MFTLLKRFLQSTWATPIIVGAALIVYLLSTGQVYDYDSLYYAHQIEDRQILLHAYHPLQNPMTWLVWKGAELINPAIRVLQAGDAAAGEYFQMSLKSKK